MLLPIVEQDGKRGVMSYLLSQEQQQKQSQKQTQRMMMTPQMQQAIHLLQLPIMELAQAIELELEQNPVLEYLPLEISPDEEEQEEEDQNEGEEQNEEKEIEFDDKQLDILKHLDEDFRDLFADSGQFIPKRSNEEEKRKAFLESMITVTPSLFDHLMAQARETFSEPEDLKIAELLLGHLDENGLIPTPLEEIAHNFQLRPKRIAVVLKKIQTFEPVGVGARNVKEVLLIQLKVKKKQDTLAYKIVEQHFDDLIHNRLPIIQKALKASLEEILKAIQQDIMHLDLHPGTTVTSDISPTMVPDAKIRQDEEQLVVDINEEQLLPLRLNRKYLRMLDDESLPMETKDFIRNKILSAKWLLKNILQRNETLSRIATFLADYHRKYFLQPDGKLKPLTMKQIADELNLHESTIARAVANKYIETPKGLFPFRYFFSNAYIDAHGNDVSSKTVKGLIREFVDKEDKRHPLSDQSLSKAIQAQGIKCARRTVAKYRIELKIGNTQQRRQY